MIFNPGVGDGDSADDPRVRIPADLDRPDPILLGLSARQLAILGAGGLATWTLARLLQPLLALPLAALLAAPLGLAGAALALGWRDGLALDRLALAGLGWWRHPKRLVAAPDGLPATPAWAGPAGPRLVPLAGPIGGLAPSGVLELAGQGWALICAATPVQLGLRNPAEQQQLLAGFARTLHALTGPTQILVRNQRADLGPLARRVRAQAPALTHPALAQATVGYAGWLEDLTGRQPPRHRELLVIFHQPPGTPNPAAALTRQADQAAALLATAGVTLTVLDADASARLIAGAANPDQPPRPAGLAPAGAVITGRAR